ncbi:unnamed protein product [Arctia plantaginis]|uniref:sulfite oxidase n=1 Tax=Arctia plantaginis TaxID=874455 RepID=A0A8S1B9I6_ARCPL|nr:unnamed protein product [Arctia plantaginis]
MLLKNIFINTFHQRKKFVNAVATVVRLNYDKWNRNKQKWQYRNNKTIAALFTSGIILKTIKDDLEKDIPKNVSNKKDGNGGDNGDGEAGQKRPDLPVYRADEVSKHDTTDSFWVIYKHGVYDITKFLPSHPGGKQILNAGGLSIEPFWNLYGMHKTKPIYQLLESYRIGNLHDDDVVDMSGNELWVSEPVRDKRLIVKSKQPFNAEIPAKLIVESLDTPNELFFVRQHMPVPELEAKDHKLEIIVKNGNTHTKVFDLEQLGKMFPQSEVRAALMCAGNRRTEMSKQVKPVKGLEWQQGAVSCARWSGALLRDVLLHCGIDTRDTHGLHVIFTGSDMDATGTYFSTSIPLEQALNPNSSVILATHMNGEILPKDHGYPLRVIVPGAPAVRSVKWLQSITISKEESSSHWHQKDYRSFNASKTWETADFASAPPVYSLPVTSAICDPVDGDTCAVKGGCIEVKGYAYSGGGARVVRVDVSADGGATWLQAQELAADPAPPGRHYAWMLWTASVPVPEGLKQVELRAKATDNNFNTQPEKFEDIWNIRGILGNAYHKINVKLIH